VTRKNFNILNFRDRYRLVKKEGALLMKRKGFLFIFNLYQLDEFYVEVTIDPASKKLVMIEAFNNTNLLMPYLDTISITSLIN